MKAKCIPLSVTKQFHTYEADQRGITVEIYEGEDPIAKNNHHVGYFNFVVPRSLRARCHADAASLAGDEAANDGNDGGDGDSEGEGNGEEAATLPVTFTLSSAGVLQVGVSPI